MQRTPTPSNNSVGIMTSTEEDSGRRESHRAEARHRTADLEQHRLEGSWQQQHREDSGLCIKCGRELFRIKTTKKGILRRKVSSVQRVPLDIPDQVRRGQCLKCGEDSAATSSVSDDLEGFAVRPAGGKGTCEATYQGSRNIYRERDGHGTMKWANGDVYTGDFFNGNRHGNGTLTFADGSEYVGEWECNLQHGMGTRRWKNGDCYSGQYKNGKRTGEGRFYFSNGDMYTGSLLDGVMEGFGRYYYSSGLRFEGTFLGGKRHGRGKLQRLDGSVEISVYENDGRRGVGVRWSADRTRAWKMLDGIVKNKISVTEAVALSYDIDASVRNLDNRIV